ncbi:MAG: CDP-alcohol phosphatidyltransferase family protein [Nitrospiraceae bacterium]|nr:CDP-alcohol phosphatidyltransferase family protein [Nitrospiraceae bacterium]
MPQAVNLPNSLTVFRIFLTPFLLGLIVYGKMKEAFWFFLIGSLSDALDGMMARLLGQKTDLGRFLDPAADKILLSTTLLTLAVLEKVPVWISIALVSRDLIIVFGFLVLRLVDTPIPINPTGLGKVATTLEMAYLFFVLSGLAGYAYVSETDYVGDLAVGLSLVSGGYYISQGFLWYQHYKA